MGSIMLSTVRILSCVIVVRMSIIVQLLEAEKLVMFYRNVTKVFLQSHESKFFIVYKPPADLLVPIRSSKIMRGERIVKYTVEWNLPLLAQNTCTMARRKHHRLPTVHIRALPFVLLNVSNVYLTLHR